jgi:hypothetical protein
VKFYWGVDVTLLPRVLRGVGYRMEFYGWTTERFAIGIFVRLEPPDEDGARERVKSDPPCALRPSPGD